MTDVTRLRAGDLRERITLQQRNAGQDTFGQQVTTWSDVATVWAKAEPLSGREFAEAGQTQAALDVRFTIRWRSGVTQAQRVSWRSALYDVVSAVDVEARRVKLELLCTHGIREGR